MVSINPKYRHLYPEVAKTDEEYEAEARNRESAYFSGQERLGAKRRIEHGIPNAATQDTVTPAKTSEGRIIGKGLGPQDRFRNT